MHLKSFELSGYMGVPFDEEQSLKIQHFGRKTAFIGPNNSGKSIPFRIMNLLFQLFSKNPFPFQGNIHPPDMRRNEFWMHLEKDPISVRIVFSIFDGPTQSEHLPGELVHKKKCVLHAVIKSTPDPSSFIFNLVPHTFFQSKWQPVIITDEQGRSEFLQENGPHSNQLASEWIQSISRLYRHIVDRTKFFDTTRALDRGGQAPLLDGSKVIEDFHNLRQTEALAKEWSNLKDELTQCINKVLEPCGIVGISDIDTKENEKRNPVLNVNFKHAGHVPINVMNTGSGIAQLVILLTELIKSPDKYRTVFIEEPETNLHPGLLRKLLLFLDRFQNTHFIFTSHSNVLLDALGHGDSIYRFRQNSDGACLAEPCNTIIDKHDLLDALGVSSSTLLQTNCVIWVEGPSDRLYIRKWLKSVDADLVEGVDFNFVFYGGSVLAHLSLELDEDDELDLVEMLRVSRFSAVIMDRDLQPTQSDDKLKKHPKRVINEGESDPAHRFTKITDGREIENDVTTEAFLSGVAKHLNRERSDFDNCELPGNKRYPDEINDHLTLDESEAKTTKNKLSKKVKLAEAVLKAVEDEKLDFDPPGYMTELAEFIKRSRVDNTSHAKQD